MDRRSGGEEVDQHSGEEEVDQWREEEVDQCSREGAPLPEKRKKGLAFCYIGAEG